MSSEGGFELLMAEAFMVGSLGSWDPENKGVMTALGVRRHYAQLFGNLSTISAIQGSRQIWATSLPLSFVPV